MISLGYGRKGAHLGKQPLEHKRSEEHGLKAVLPGGTRGDGV